GPRSSEVIGLKRKCVDLLTGWLLIRSRYRRGDEDIPKSESSIRELPLGDLIDEYRARCRGLAPDDYVFVSPDGKPYDDRGIQHYVLRPAAKAAGVYYL